MDEGSGRSGCAVSGAGVHVVVTRPEPECGQWVQALSRAGWTALALPLMEIRPTRDTEALAACWRRLDQTQAVMFVSAAAVRHFWAARPQACPHPAQACWRAWVTGAGTARALMAHGMPAERIDQPAATSVEMDSEALWVQLEDQLPPGAATPVQRVLIVRGADDQGRMAGRDWLAQQLRDRGVAVDFAVAYERHAPGWTAQQIAQAHRAAGQEGCARGVWIFSSSEALRQLQVLLPRQSWSAATAVVTHSRIAQAAAKMGFGVVQVSRPGLAAVTASIESLL